MNIKPPDPNLLGDLDVDYAHFDCCGDEDLIFVRCEHCGHIWVECHECSTWYVDLGDLARRESSSLSDRNARLSCPACSVPFEDFDYLGKNRYAASAEQVVAAGFERYLAEHLRRAK